MLSRREILYGAATLPVFGGVALAPTSPSLAQTADDVTSDMESFGPLPAGFNDGMFRNPDKNVNFGATPPPAIYSALAGAILRGSPFNCRPIDVAYYFANLREKKLPESVAAEAMAIAQQAGQPQLAAPEFLAIFAYDWERNHYYNPAVIGFFQGVGLKPYAGDQTPWCATFANWCISRSRASQSAQIVFNERLRAFGTRNASSGSFRCWGTQASEPQEGDVIVWAHRGTVTGSCPTVGRGHVGFLSGIDIGPDGRRRYRVVGGNQGFKGNTAERAAGSPVRPEDVAQAVSRRTIGTEFGANVLHSIRTQTFNR